MTIAYVDDDPDDLDLFREAIKVIGNQITLHTFQTCGELETFLSKLRTPPSFIFIDVNMPKMNGYQCATAVRKLSPAHIVLISAAFHPGHQKDFQMEQTSFMTKSVTITETVQALSKLLITETPG